MYEVVRWLPNGEAKYWNGHSFTFNPFGAERMTREAANYVRADLLSQGYSRDDIEVVPA